MSATIFWRPLPTTNRTLPVSAPSSFLAAMERAFGSPPPWRLGAEHVNLLRGMAALHGGLDRDNPFAEMVSHMLDDEGNVRDIEVWAEY